MNKNKHYNIFSKLAENLADFDKGFYITGKPSNSDTWQKSQSLKRGGYFYDQTDTLEAVDLAINSKFKDTQYEKDGSKKAYLNIVNFHSDVSLMKVDVNTYNFILEPETLADTWSVMFMDKKFKEWADEESYDDIIDELAYDYVKRGTCVEKKVRGTVERVPLRSIRCTQSAKSLKEAAKYGGYVIIENEMNYAKMKEYKGWDLEGLEYEKNYIIQERYSLVPKSVILEYKGQKIKDTDYDDYVLAVQILLPYECKTDGSKYKKGEEDGHILFIEEIDEVPLEEAHYERIDGRWLGRGEVEKQLEAQMARNFTANLRRRSLKWATKKLFQSSDDEVQKNLMREVEDGTVIKINKDRMISQINAQTQHLGDFSADENAWKENSQNNGFSFDVATGRTMTSGTPFRLGVILEQAVSDYFKLKQDTFVNFLKRSFFSQIIPSFKKGFEEHTLRYALADDNIDLIREKMTHIKAIDEVKKSYLKGKPKSYAEVRRIVENSLRKSPYIFVDVMENIYENAQEHIKLNINEPIAADMTTLTQIFEILVSRGDPRADRVLNMILSKQGKNLDYILGAGQMQPQQQTVGQTMETPQFGSDVATTSTTAEANV